ncbi:hypothetical protein ACVJGD_008429 [Bradyrhizobium sp. USDA 10063]
MFEANNGPALAFSMIDQQDLLGTVGSFHVAAPRYQAISCNVTAAVATTVADKAESNVVRLCNFAAIPALSDLSGQDRTTFSDWAQSCVGQGRASCHTRKTGSLPKRSGLTLL